MIKNDFPTLNDIEAKKNSLIKLKLADVRHPQKICNTRSLVSKKLEDLIFKNWELKDLDRITSVLKRKSLVLEDLESTKKTLCCMDDRIIKWDQELSIAWSWLLIISDLISKWLKWDEIISFLSKIFNWNNITTITSHQDCWAAWLFYKSLVEYFNLWDNNSLKTIIKKLDLIFPWILDTDFNKEKILTSGKEDLIAALVLKYISKKCNLEYWHIELWEDFLDIPDHDSRSIVIDLTNYNLSWFFKKNNINPWYFLDASMFLENIDLIEKITQEAIIWKLIAKKEPGICKDNKMIVSIVSEKNDVNQITLAQKIKNDIISNIDRDYHELIWKFEIVLIKI